jgi:hypothetical protein
MDDLTTARLELDSDRPLAGQPLGPLFRLACAPEEVAERLQPVADGDPGRGGASVRDLGERCSECQDERDRLLGRC